MIIIFLFKIVQSQDKIINLVTQKHKIFDIFLIQVQFDSLKYKTLVDTGSSKLIAKGWQCQGDPLVRLKVVGNKNCDQKNKVSIKYIQGTVQGNLCNVKVKSGSSAFQTVMVVTTKCQVQMQVHQSIMGLNGMDSQSFISRMSIMKTITNKELSIYLSLPNGKVVLGDVELINADFTKGSFTGTYKDKYQFPLISMIINKVQKTLAGIKILIDTGSSVSLIPATILLTYNTQLQKLLKNKKCVIVQSPKNANLCHIVCMKITKAEKDLIPTLGIKMQNVLTFNPNKFLECQANKNPPNTQNCLINVMTLKNAATTSIMGCNLLYGMLILIDDKAKQYNLVYIKK